MGKTVNGGGAVMDKLSRRKLLRALAGGALSTVGTVVLARTSLAAFGTPENVTGADVQARAASLDEAGLGSLGEAHAQFLNVGVPGIGFGNGGFRNGGFLNGGGFRNGGFRNGGFRNGGFRNGGFRNGGFRNGGFRNW
jgi:hypothetical protein